MRVLCLGGSYTGKYLASNFPEAEVTFLARDADRLRGDGFRAIDPNAVADERVDLIVDTVPTVKVHGKIHLPYRVALEPLMAGTDSQGLPVYMHLSTTSVYPADFSARRQEDLPTQDEDTPVGPDSERAKDRLLLEHAVSSTYADARILRCGGIYGPGRCVATRFRDGDFSRAGTGNRMVTRIHVHDLCRLILAFGRTDAGGGIDTVNAVDARPSSNRETFDHLEGVLDIEVPGDWRDSSPVGRMVISKYASSLLGGSYTFPTYKEGFAQCLGN